MGPMWDPFEGELGGLPFESQGGDTSITPAVVAIVAAIDAPTIQTPVQAPAVVVVVVIPALQILPIHASVVTATVAVPNVAVTTSARVFPATVAVVAVIPAPIVVIVSTPTGNCLNCGQGNPCNCDTVAAGLSTVSGAGSEASPFVVDLTCEAVQDCVAELFTCLDLTYDDAAGTMLANGADGEGLIALGDGCAEWGPVFSLAGPFVEYDTRLWAGGATVPNLGSAGSFYDLTVVGFTDGDMSGQFARKDVGGLSHDPWAGIGGNADTAGFVLVVAVSGRPQDLGSNNHDAQVEADMIFNNDVPTDRFHLHVVQFSPTLGNLTVEANYEIDTVGANDRQMNYTPSPDPDTADTVIVMHYNPLAGTYGVWLDGVAIPIGDLFAQNMGPGINLPSVTFTDVFFYLGQDYPATASGKWASGAYASALYRGDPTAYDITYLQAVYA